jgi:hypothetical protein
MAEYHLLDCGHIDSVDEIDDCNQLALTWCTTHKKYEWHNIPRHNVKSGGHIVANRKPVKW